MAPFWLKFWLVAAILNVSSSSQLKNSPGIQYGQDCKPFQSLLDVGILEKVVTSPVYREKFGDKPIMFLREDEWTTEMEDTYGEGMLGDNARCSLIEGFDCELKTNENSYEVNFHHHHHPKSTGGLKKEEPNPSETLFEPRRADVVVESNLKDFDLIAEVDPEWRCVCNPSISVHRSTQVEDSSRPYPYFIDKCLVKVGAPCKYKKGDRSHAHFFKEEYQCVPEAECLPVFDQSAPTDNVSDTVVTSPLPLIPTNVSGIQVEIRKKVGYELRLGSVRPAYLNYVIRHLTHVCQCRLGFRPNGIGLCVQAYGLEARGFELNSGSGQEFDLSHFLILVIIIISLITNCQ